MNNTVISILSLSVSGSILALILLTGKPLLKNRVSKAFSYYIWLLVLMRLIVPISAPVNVIGTLFHSEQSGAVDITPEQTDSPTVGNAVGTVGESAVTTNTQTTPSQERQNAEGQTNANLKLSFGFIQSNLLWLWLAGAAVSIGWFSIAYMIFVRRIRRSCTAPQFDDLSVFENLRGRMHVRLVCSRCVTTPMSIGILRPVIVLPQLAYIHNGMGDELKNIFLHELTHCKRKDVLYKWLVIVATSLHWFNPLMHWIRKEIGLVCELSCDEAVIRNMSESERQFYGNTLLTFSAGRKLPNGILATTLCEGKEQLKERLITIKHYKKKSTLVVALTLILALLLAGCAVALGVASGGADDTGNTADSLDATVYAEGIDGLAVSHDAGHTYYLGDDGTVYISYNNGETVSETPLILDMSDLELVSMEDYETGFFISEAVTAIAHGGDNAPIQVLISRDMGETWNTYTVEGSETMSTEKYIGFVTEDDGWLVASTGTAAGLSYHYVFRTSDGGKTWTQTGNPNELYPRNITGAGFATADIAFLSFRVDSDPGPTIYLTQDGGATWAQLNVTVPGEYDYNIPLSPFFSGADGIYPIQSKTSDNGDYITYYLTSDDYGQTWMYDTYLGTVETSSMSSYLTYELRDTLVSGAFDSELGYLGGCLFCLKDTGSSEAAEASESAASTGWNSYGGVEIYYNLNCTFVNGKLTAVSLPWNHSAYLNEAQPIDGCASPALIVQVSHDLYTAAEAEKYNIDEDRLTSTMWCVFFTEEYSDISYAVNLNADYFNEEDVIALARSVVFKDGAFDVEVETGESGEDTSGDSGQSGQIDDGEVWLVQREDYEVGLRNQGDQTEILLQRDGTVTVLDSVPSNSDTGMRYSLRSFDAIPELSGFVLENMSGFGQYDWYYAVQDNSAFCFAYSFGLDLTDIAEDLDGDGMAELICNVTYMGDGVSDVLVYRMKDGIPQVASVKDAMLNIPADKHMARLAFATYDVNTGSVTLEYQIADEDDARVETAPIDYDSLQFEDFNYTETW